MVNSVRAVGGGLQLQKPSAEEDWPNTYVIKKRSRAHQKPNGKPELKYGHSQLVSIYLSLQSKNRALGYSVALQGHYCGWEDSQKAAILCPCVRARLK